MLSMTTPKKSRGGSAKKPNRTGKALNVYIDPALRDDMARLAEALDVGLTSLTETALRMLLHTVGWGEKPDKIWLSLRPPKPDVEE